MLKQNVSFDILFGKHRIPIYQTQKIRHFVLSLLYKTFGKMANVILPKIDWLKCTLCILTVVVIIFSYRKIFGGFFQHDEWHAFGHYLSGGENLLTAFIPYVSHYAPLTTLFFLLYVSVLQLNFFWYALFSILAHLIVVCLSYILFSKLLKNRMLGFLSSLFFALVASGHQATSWIAADINTHGSVIFGLLAFIVLFNSNFQKIWPSIAFLIISLLFKEITIALFVLLPLFAYLFDRENFLKNRLNHLKFVFVGFLYFIFRFSMIFFQRTYVEDRLVIETQSLSDVLANIITFPAKIFAQSLIPTGQLLSLARFITKRLPLNLTGLYGTTAFDVFTEGVTLQVLSWLIFLICSFVLIYVLGKVKNGILKKTAIFGFIFTVLNSFIYVLSPGRSGSIPVVDSRNIYLPSLGAALFIISVVFGLAKEKVVKTVLIIIPLIILNFFWLDKELNFLADRGTERKEILYQIKRSHPTLPAKVIFYMVSDTSFYGLPESIKMFPFEINLGYTLLVWYLPTEHFPRQLVDQTNFLYGLTEEGYKEMNGRGFGYFRNWDSFTWAVKENNLGSDSIIAFSYNSKTRLITDITSQTKTLMAQDIKLTL